MVHGLDAELDADKERVRRLFEQLDMHIEHLMPTQQQQLREFLSGFADMLH